MKNCIFFLLVLISATGFSQPMLGKDREFVLKTIREDEDLSRLTEGTASDGSHYIVAFNSENDMLKWSISQGVVQQYLMVIHPANLNKYIIFMNKYYVQDQTYQWSDYSSGTRVYWHLFESGSFFELVASWYDLEL